MPTEANFPRQSYVLGRFSMAGFEVIIYGRFWVITEVLVYCCLGLQFFAYAVLIRREYYQPYPDDQRVARMKILKRTMFIVCLISWMGIAIAQWAL